jgi:hypothetical protein
MGTESKLSFSEMHIGGIDVGSMVTSTAPGFRGSMQQLSFNGENLFELAKTGQLAIQHTVSEFILPPHHAEGLVYPKVLAKKTDFR